MATLNMEGPFKLDSISVNAAIKDKSPGNYALGWITDEGMFYVNYVGRDDEDVNSRLHTHIDTENNKYFKFSYAPHSKAAYEKECIDYHNFKPQGNNGHPEPMDNENWECPHCGFCPNSKGTIEKK